MMKQKTLVRASVALVLVLALLAAPSAMAAPDRHADRTAGVTDWLGEVVTYAYGLLVRSWLGEPEPSFPGQTGETGILSLSAAEDEGPALDPLG